MISTQVLLEPLPVLANLAPTRLYVAAKTFTTSNIWDVLFLVPRALVADFGASFAAVRDALCGNQNFTARSSTRRLLDGVAMPVPHRSTELARSRHRREMTW